MTAVLTGFVLTIHLNDADLGGVPAFNFSIRVSGDKGNTTGETAPDSGVYTYELGSQPPTTTAPLPTLQPPTLPLRLQVVKLTLPPAKAGKRFRVEIDVRRPDKRIPLTGGTLTCSAKVAGRALRASARTAPRNGVAACSWLLPKASKGKTITGQVAVAYKGARVSRAFSTDIG